MNNKNKGSLRKITNGQSCAAKLNLLNEHFLRQTLYQGNFMQSMRLNQKNNLDNIPIVKIGQSFSIIFSDFSTKSFRVIKQLIPDDRRYTLKISSKHVDTFVKMVIDGERQKKYVVKKLKAIIIQEREWKEIEVILKIQKESILSFVKVQIDTIKAQFRTKSVNCLLRKADVKKELQQYIQANLKNVEAIKQRLKSQSQRNLFTRSKSFGIRTIRSRGNSSPRKSDQVSIRKRLIQFESSKGFYLKHLKKMNPSRQAEFQRSKLDFYTRKSIQLIKFTTMVLSINFIKHLYDIKLHFHQNNMKTIQTAFLCKKFVKNLKKANKCKIVQSSRGKQAIRLLNCFLANTVRTHAVKTAQQNLVKQLRQLLFFSDSFYVCYYSQKYKSACQIIQKWWKKKLKRIIKKRNEMKVEVSHIVHQKPTKQQSKLHKKSSFFYRVT